MGFRVIYRPKLKFTRENLEHQLAQQTYKLRPKKLSASEVQKSCDLKLTQKHVSTSWAKKS